jgi:formiminotetrahydrofolate cyclodeaminase
MSTTTYADSSVAEFLASVATREPTPSAGALVALSVASAAGLAAMAARFAASAELTGLAEPADALRVMLVSLADQDARAYARVLAAVALPSDTPARSRRRTEALTEATEIPLVVASAGVEIAAMGARLAEQGNPNLAGDARAAVLLAEAGVRASAELVRINVRHGRLDAALEQTAEQRVRSAAEYV